MEEKQEPRSDLLSNEDWWTVWFGIFIILVGTLYGFLYQADKLPKLAAPKMGTWVSNPLDAFNRDAKKKIKLSATVTVADVVENINRLKTEVKAELVPINAPSPAKAPKVFPPREIGPSPEAEAMQSGDSGKTEAEDSPAPSEAVKPQPANYRLVISSTRSGPGQTIAVKVTLKQEQVFKFTAEDKDPDGMGAMRYVSQEVDSPQAKIGTGTLQITIERKNKVLIPILVSLIALGLICSVGLKVMGEKAGKFLGAYFFVALLTFVALFVQYQKTIKAYGLSYAFWALLFGLLISNTVGTPKFIMHAVKTEMYIKTGLVLLGAEILFGKILRLGVPGLMVAWIVTPTVVTFMYFFGTRTLKMVSKPLVTIIAMATSVCGVSAAIAAAAATRAKKEELTLGVGMTLIFTVLMMIFMPLGIKAVGMSPVLGGAWMGGTIDSTGAVVAAGAMLGADAETVAAVVKMVQNVLIGLLGFVLAVIWVTKVDRDPNAPKPRLIEIWVRFPKFIVGFVLASLIFSFVLVPLFGTLFGKVGALMSSGLPLVEKNVIKPVTNPLRGLFFCLAFVSIGLESNFRDLASQLVGGKPIMLYIIGQSFNLALTLFVAWIAFIMLFPNVIG
ncbi:MAG: putative sulfate exporter family transporter [Desulfobacterales bacterium]|nr:MAG: putative sulfate exporter family transporter [Desulfobacterales bacterium]